MVEIHITLDFISTPTPLSSDDSHAHIGGRAGNPSEFRAAMETVVGRGRRVQNNNWVNFLEGVVFVLSVTVVGLIQFPITLVLAFIFWASGGAEPVIFTLVLPEQSSSQPAVPMNNFSRRVLGSKNYSAVHGVISRNALA